VSDLRRTLPRLAATLLVSATVAVLSVPAAQSTRASAPTDFFRSQQWILGALHVSQAWSYSRGQGVTVAVLDTGVDGRQADLSGQVTNGPDYTGGLRHPGTRFWGRHGTSMASVIAAHGHGRSSGIMGVAPESKILSIRAAWELADPARLKGARASRARTAVARGIRYAADHGAQVISMSLGGGKHFYNGNRLEEAAVRYALRKGVVLVASAGNDGAGANRRTYPAAYPGVIAVGAVDRAFRPTSFTNRHTYVSVAAPGTQVISADVAGQGYVSSSGTSVSAALVAGMSALIKSRYPRLAPAEVKQALEQGATHRPAEGRSSAIGTGVADAFGALRAAALINQAEHGGAAVNAPPASPVPTPKGGDPDVVVIAVLSGGGTLMALSLILGWRRRRRHTPRYEPPEPAPPMRPIDETPWRPREPEVPEPPPVQRYEPPPRTAANGSRPPHDEPPAEVSWESIHEGFDRIKEDTRNWGWSWRDDPAGGDDA
jgi:serine protease